MDNITWSQADFRKLLYLRIKYEMDKLGIQDSTPPENAMTDEIEQHIIEKIFVKRVYWGKSDRRTYQVLYTLSYHRPRWAIQLCKLAQKEAIRDDSDRITKSHIDSVWGSYGTKRIADLIAEHKHQCSDIEEIIVGFRGADRRMSRDELLLWIRNHITNHMTPLIEGRAQSNPVEIAHFMFRLGFIVARVDSEDDKSYEHYYFADMPDFLSTRTNNDFGAVWEVHPCYREALNIKKLNRFQMQMRNLAR